MINDKIYILDERQKKVLIFDDKGKFIRAFYHRGQRSDEYLYLSDFSIKGDTIYVLDDMKAKILLYKMSFRDTFISSIDVENAKGLHVWDFGKYSFYRGLGYADYSADNHNYSYAYCENNILKNEKVAFNKKVRGRGYSQSVGDNKFYYYNDSLFTIFPFNDTIYNIVENGDILPYMVVKVGEPINYEDNNLIEKINTGDIFISIFLYYKLNGYTFFAYSYKNEPTKYVIMNNKNDIIFNSPFNLDENKLPIHPVTYNGKTNFDGLLSVTYPIEIFSILNRNKKESVELLKEISEHTNEEGNPVLIFYTLKH